MAASFPASIKSFTTKVNGNAAQAADVNDLQDEVVAIETALGASVAAIVNPAAVQGFKAWTIDPAGALGAGKQINAVGLLHLARFIAPKSDTITNINFNVTGAGTTSTCHVALYSAAGALLKQSSSAVSTTATGLKTVALSSAQAIVAGTIYYVGVWCVTGSGSAPSLQATTNSAAGGSGQFSTSTGLVAPNFRCCTADGSLSNTAPANFGTQSSIDNLLWFGLS